MTTHIIDNSDHFKHTKQKSNRTVGPEIFGIANVEFYVVYSAAQFLSREYVRKSSIIFTKTRTNPSQASQRQIEGQIFSLGWCAVLVSFLISILIFLSFGNKNQNLTDSLSDGYRKGILFCTISGLIEMFAEPLILIATIRVWSRQISAMEALGLFLKCIFAFIAIKFLNETDDKNQYLLSFGIAQILASSIVVIIWYYMFYQQIGDLFSRLRRIEPELIKSSFMFFLQGFVKFGLTEGEKLVMIQLQIEATIQGIYSLVSNLGSLVARYIFAQIEKSANTEFSKLDINKNKRVITEILSNVLKIVTILAALCVTFSPNYSYMVLDILYGEKWSETNAPNALSFYCWYLLFMSINGITEAFVQSETPSKYYQAFLIMVTCIYWLCVAYFIMNNYGVYGLIMANCINMLIRIIYNCWYIHYNISLSHIFMPIFKSVILFLTLIVSYGITNKTNELLVDDQDYALCGGKKLICYGIHSGVAVLCLIVIGGVLLRFERQFVNDTRRLLLGRRA